MRSRACEREVAAGVSGGAHLSSICRSPHYVACPFPPFHPHPQALCCLLIRLFCFQYINLAVFPVFPSQSPSFREEMLTHSLRKLREQIVKANLYVREANFIGEELDKRTEYKVTLQIPASSLNANSKVQSP